MLPSGEGSLQEALVSDLAVRRGGAFGVEAGPRQYLLELHEVRVTQPPTRTRRQLSVRIFRLCSDDGNSSARTEGFSARLTGFLGN